LALAKTDAGGRFTLPSEADAWTLVAVHPQGYAELPSAPMAIVDAKGVHPMGHAELFRDGGVVKLQPWGRLEGQMLLGDKPGAGQLLDVQSVRPFGAGYAACIHHNAMVTADAEGRFVVERVAAPKAFVSPISKTKDGWTTICGTGAWVEIGAGQTTRITLGGKGRPVVGRFEAPLEVDWSKVSSRLALRAPHVGLPGDAEQWAAYGKFLTGERAKLYCRDDIPIRPDGSFRVEGVPQGEYQLIVWVYGRAIGDDARAGQVATQTGTSLTVLPMPAGQSAEPLDVGTIQVPARRP
jgi:hypothetical protein